jgi:oxygen-independent coproporphyrinogen-3 oxidase
MFNIRFFDYFGEEVDMLKPMVDDEMVEVHRGGVQATIKVTERGRLLIRCICMVFDKYLNNSIKYSKVI